MLEVNTLVILPCHSIWKCGPTLGESRNEWCLVNFQIEGYDHLCFKEHITQCLQLLESDESSYLVISGGQTKSECPNVSESLSYYNLACKLTENLELLKRITTEEFARDSFENVLFSVCRYFEIFNRYPERIKIVGFEFKRERFVKYHLIEALKFPISVVEYIGNNPNPIDLDQTEREHYFKDLEESEYNFAVRHFREDYYGLASFLGKKKSVRNPFKRCHGYIQSNPTLAQFLSAIADGSETTSKEAKNLLEEFWTNKY